MRLILATGVDEPYTRKRAFGMWCNSVLQHHSPALPVVFGYGFRPVLRMEQRGSIKTVEVPEEHIRLKFRNRCLQNGDFLNWRDWQSDDVIVFTDADEVMQRQWMPDELRLLNNWPRRAVGMAHNFQGNMLYDAELLHPTDKFAAIKEKYQGVMDRECYACGVLVMRQSTYRTLYERCVDLWPEIEGCFDHYAEEQWLINLVVHLYDDLNPMVLPWTFHAHDVNGMPPGARRLPNGMVIVDGIPALFRHFVRSYR